jgi:PAS domain S-box-containing protein
MVSFLFLFGCRNDSINKNPPRVINAVLDLNNWDLKENGPIDLTGEWEFYWNQHLTPKDFSKSNPPAKTDLIYVPGSWNGHFSEGKPLSGDGYATYRMKVLMNNQKGRLAFNLLDIGTAYTVFVNGEKISSAGIAGKTIETTVPSFSREVSDFISNTNIVEIVLQVSNFHHRLGGAWEGIQFGTENQIRKIRERSLAFDLFLCGSILIISLYHFCLYFLRKDDRSMLYFGIFCFLIVLRLLSTGDRYLLLLFPFIDWEFTVKIEYLSFYLAVPFFGLFLHSVFKRKFSLRMLRGIQVLGILFSCIVLLAPARFYSNTVQLYQIITVIGCIYGVYVLVLALVRKTEGAFLFFLGFIVLVFTVISDIMYSRMVTQTGYYTPLGLLIFISFQSFLLSRRFSMAFNTIEKQSQELKETNKAYRREIKARQQTENALKEAYSIINRSPAVTFLWKNAEGWPVEFVSDNVADLFGYSAEEFISGKVSYAQTVHPDDLQRVAQEVETFSSDNDRTVFVHEPYRIIAKQGNIKWLDDRTYIRRDTKGTITHYEGIVIDITENVQAAEILRESEEKLIRFKKMESLGLLAGGVAHDLNNVLSGIVSYPDLLLLKLPGDSPIRESIETIKASGRRAASIVQDLLTVARGVATTKEPLNLNDLITDYLNSPEFKKLNQSHPFVTVKTNLVEDLFNISGSQVHIRKVVMNLVSNAAESIKGNGNITISTVNRYVDTPLKGYDTINVGEYAVMAVSDDGLGISPNDLERIFEPFYTKKIMGRRSGTGLGLAVVWNVMQDHKGYIDVTSGANGTTFELFFAITREEISNKDLSIAFKDLKGNGEAILVVDDTEGQRDIACKMLEVFGYKTKAVCSGELAVEYLKENTVDLILLDMIMDPGINGREAYERIIKIHPKQKAIIVSGFAETDDVRETQKLGAGKFLRKPLTIEEIGLAVKEEIQK